MHVLMCFSGVHPDDARPDEAGVSTQGKHTTDERRPPCTLRIQDALPHGEVIVATHKNAERRSAEAVSQKPCLQKAVRPETTTPTLGIFLAVSSAPRETASANSSVRTRSWRADAPFFFTLERGLVLRGRWRPRLTPGERRLYSLPTLIS